MKFRISRWIVGMLMFCGGISHASSWGVAAEPSQEPTQAEGEIGTRAMPMQKLGVERAPGVHMVPNLSAAVVPPSRLWRLGVRRVSVRRRARGRAR